MKKILIALLLVFVLSGCNQSFKCTKGTESVKYTYNDEELVSVTRNGDPVGTLELGILDASYKIQGPEKFESSTIKLQESLGYICK